MVAIHRAPYQTAHNTKLPTRLQDTRLYKTTRLKTDFYDDLGRLYGWEADSPNQFKFWLPFSIIVLLMTMGMMTAQKNFSRVQVR